MDNILNEQMSTPFSGDTFMEKHFLDLKERFKIKTVIETGTYKGSTTLWLDKHFDDVHTSEINANLYSFLQQRFKGTKIKLWCAGSEHALMNILMHIDDTQPLIFLDAHWYKNPLLSELHTIATHGIKPVIAIHDFKVPDHPELGYDVYPKQSITYDFAYIKESIENIYGKNGYDYHYNSEATGDKRGCIFIYPKESK